MRQESFTVSLSRVTVSLSRVTLTIEIVLVALLLINGRPAECTLSYPISRLLKDKRVKEVCVDKDGRLYPCPQLRETD